MFTVEISEFFFLRRILCMKGISGTIFFVSEIVYMMWDKTLKAHLRGVHFQSVTLVCGKTLGCVQNIGNPVQGQKISKVEVIRLLNLTD